MQTRHTQRLFAGRWSLTALTVIIAAAMIAAACGTSPEATETEGSGSGDDQAEGTPDAPTTGAEAQQLSMGLGPPLYQFLPLYTADSEGFFEEAGLEVDMNIFETGPDQRQAMLAGEIDVACSGSNDPILLTARGESTVIFSTVSEAADYKIMSDPEVVGSVDDIPGHTIATSGPGSFTELIAFAALSGAGVDTETVQSQQVGGGSPGRFGALQSGAVDLAVLDAPTYVFAERDGYHSLVSVAEELSGFTWLVCFAPSRVIDERSEVLGRFVQGYRAAMEFVLDESNSDQLGQIAQEYMGMAEEDTAIAYETAVGFFSETGVPNRDGIELALQTYAEWGDIDGIEDVTLDEVLNTEIAAE